MTVARKEIIVPNEENTYHCISRCVRQAFLCGLDKLSGKNFDHRKEWVRERIKFLLTIFTIEVLAYALMSNHLHLLLRLLREVLSDEEVAKRWYKLYPKRRTPSGAPCEPNENEIKLMTSDPARIEELRARLGSISWFMKSLNEHIARQANKEDDCKGRFWEGRFKCQRIQNEAAVLSCAAYVDLNPVRAKIADTPEESLFTSAWERIEAFKAKEQLAALEETGTASERTLEKLRQRSNMDSWLAPLQQTDLRPGFLSISLPEYLSLLDWTGRQIKYGKRGKIPDNLAPIMERLRIDPERWVDTTQNYGHWFYRVVGDAEWMAAAAKAAGKSWFQGLRAARKVFLKPVVSCL